MGLRERTMMRVFVIALSLLASGCLSSTVDPAPSPARTEIYMDMYFRGHVETRPVAGFTLAP